MELKQALDRLAELQRKMYAYRAASSSLYLDGTTVAPKDTAEGRGVALGVLAGEQHKLFSDPQVGELLDFLWAHKDGLDRPVRRQVEELRRLEDRPLPPDMDYLGIQGLRLEARQKLDKIRPLNLGQASRVSGVSPADVTALMIYLERGSRDGDHNL